VLSDLGSGENITLIAASGTAVCKVWAIGA
jgi:hypothetical protein